MSNCLKSHAAAQIFISVFTNVEEEVEEVLNHANKSTYLTFFRQMEFSIKLQTIQYVWSIVCNEGSHVIQIYFSEDRYFFRKQR